MAKTKSSPGVPTEKPSASAAVDNTLTLASVGVAAAQTLETLLPSAAGAVEKASHNLANHFTVLAQDIAIQDKLISTLLEMLESSGNNKSECRDMRELATTTSKNLSTAISGVIIDMQFQDRNTQVMESASHILERYSSMLEEVREKIQDARGESMNESADITHAIQTILSGIHIHEIISKAIEATIAGIRIHDIRQQFMASLTKANVAFNTRSAAATAAETEYTVELF
jgi:hypothetical protein